RIQQIQHHGQWTGTRCRVQVKQYNELIRKNAFNYYYTSKYNMPYCVPGGNFFIISFSQSDVISCAQHVERMDKQYVAQMEQLRSTVHSKSAVPTTQVYPLFIALSNLWNSFQDDIVLLSVLSNMIANLQPFLRFHEELFPSGSVQTLLSDIAVKTDEERIKESAGSSVNPSDFPTQEWYFPEKTANFDRLPIQYHGFCGFTIAAKDGLLLPGNPDIGILNYKERYYRFSSKEAAYMFAKDPDHYIHLIGDKAKQCAELIQLLELHQQFAAITPHSQVISSD
uniref:Cilia- and flagella-associated protein 206 n=1 Tax=Leptobrachium leishanense TaxID=445787 RepID=A0A8C5QWM6_9ANUR